MRSQQLLLSHQVDVNMTENVELGSLKADIRENERTKCLNIPNAKVDDQFSKKTTNYHFLTLGDMHRF